MTEAIKEGATPEETTKYLYLTLNKTSSAKGKNDEIWLEELPWATQAKVLKLAELGAIKESYNEISLLMKSGTGIFKEKKQPVGNKVKAFIKYHSMDEWDEVLVKYQRLGAEIQETEKKSVKKVTKTNVAEDGEFTPIAETEVQEFLDFLRSYQAETLAQSFTMSVSDVSDSRLEDAEKILKELVAAVEDINNGGNGMSIPMFNDLRSKLHGKIPRVIKNVRKDSCKKKSEFEEKIKEELAFYEFFKEQVELARSEKQIICEGQTVLEANNLEMSVLKDETEIERVKKLLGVNRGQCTRIFRAKNNTTERYFNNYCAKKKLSIGNGVTELFHGSGTENWWSIFSNGLYLKPESLGISICGKAFGHGIYFAPLAQKSMGYACGGYWKGGVSDKSYLAIFKVATGEIYDIYGESKGVPDNYEQLQAKHPGADCTWAFSRNKYSNAYLRNEEVIVYTDGSTHKDGDEKSKISQCTIEYIIEMDQNIGTL